MRRVCRGSGDGAGRAAFAWVGIGGRGEGGAEFAGGEGVEGAEAGGEFPARQAALAVEAADVVRGRGLRFARVAFQTAGDQVAIGIASQACLGDDVIQALHGGVEKTQTVEARAALAGMDGPCPSFLQGKLNRAPTFLAEPQDPGSKSEPGAPSAAF